MVYLLKMVIFYSYVKIPEGKHGGKKHLVGGWATPLKNMSSSVGMMTFPIYGEKKTHVPNHQPDTSFQQVRIIYIECVPIEHGGVSMAMP